MVLNEIQLESSNRLRSAVPFVKWAGGKSQLLPQLSRFYPERFSTYYEPFLGGGAVFFDLLSKGRITSAVLNDANKDLMNLWAAIKLEADPLMEESAKLQKETDDSSLFYKNRREFNSIELNPTFLTRPSVSKAALLLYLNKTCYNGLYRVNAEGKFNVPFGRYEHPKLFDERNLKAVSYALKDDGRAELSSTDFEAAVRDTAKHDFVYLDPPYQPLSSTASFTGYTASAFDWQDQERLAELYHKLSRKGSYLMLSNSPKVRELYEGRGYRIEVLGAARAISSVGNKRGPVEELVVMNY